MTRVAVVAGSPVLRAGLESLLAGAANVVVVGSVAERRDGDARVPIVELVAPLAPDVVVWVPDEELDDALLALRGDDDLPDGRTDHPRERGTARGRPTVVLLVDDVEAQAVARAMRAGVRAGVRAVLPREAGADEIIAAVDAAAAGLVALPADLADDLLAAPIDPAPAGAASLDRTSTALTPREREVLALLAQGLANKAIAPRLGISEHTVKAHVASIFDKLGAGTRAEAVVTAARLGVLLL
jgi:DNA-binding NarL/FixJ family response regulator